MPALWRKFPLRTDPFQSPRRLPSKHTSSPMAPREPLQPSSRGPTSHNPSPSLSMAILTPIKAFRTATPGKMTLPIELLEQIVDYMPVATQLRFARTNHTMRDMVYDDSRWVTRLKAMGAWNEDDARKAAEEEFQREREAWNRARQESVLGRTVSNGTGSTTIFDLNVESKKVMPVTPVKPITGDLLDFSQFDSPEAFGDFQSVSGEPEGPIVQSTVDPLSVLSMVVSRRGEARAEFGIVYVALAPLYLDLVNANSTDDSKVFRQRESPEEQAKLLKILELFGRARSVPDWTRCQKRMTWITETFERQMMKEFEKGYDSQDIDQMKKYANILYELNGGESAIQTFIRKNLNIFNQQENPMACITPLALNLDPLQEYTHRLSSLIDGQTRIADQVFPSPSTAMIFFINRVLDTPLMSYITTLIDRLRQNTDTEMYLKAVVGTYHQLYRFVRYLNKPKDATTQFRKTLCDHIDGLFAEHIEPYLRVELEYYKKRCDAVVESWNKKIADEANDYESAMRATTLGEKDKTNFLASFKKVILLPVSVLPTLPFPGSHSRSSTQSSQTLGRTGTPQSSTPARPSTPTAWDDQPSNAAPTTELAAQTAILNSRLERIKTLFSIEVALQLIHMGKETLERIKSFRHLEGELGDTVRHACETAFITLLTSLGQNHIQPGFEQALEHLSNGRPYQEADEQDAVGPLLTFLELVHIGDLIQQMVDVFFNQEVAGMIDRTDFLNPVVKEKKNFEQKMIDVHVAAGLNKGIDVLIAHVDHLFETKQLASDYCPPPVAVTGYRNANLEPTSAAVAAVNYLQTHTKLLQGSTDKSILDVFFQEVGLRFFGSICKHVKTLRINTDGAVRLISDFNLYHTYASSLRQLNIMAYFAALKEVGHIFIIEEGQGKAVGTMVADVIRFEGIFRPEEVYEFVQCRADWLRIKKDVERALFGLGRDDCLIM